MRRHPPLTPRNDTFIPHPTCFLSPQLARPLPSPVHSLPGSHPHSPQSSLMWKRSCHSSCSRHWLQASAVFCPLSSCRFTPCCCGPCWWRSEEHTPELQSLSRISDAVLCLQNKTISQHMDVEI